MKVTEENIGNRQVVLSIEAEPEDVEGYLEKAYRRLVQRTRIPGFRMGKAPRAVLERYVGKGVFLEEALKDFAPEVTRKAMEERLIEAIAQPRIEIEGVEPLVIKATVSLQPLLELGDYKQIRVEPEAVKVTPQQLDSVMEQLREGHASWEPVDRAVAFGDLLTIDMQGTLEGKTFVDQKGVSYIPTRDVPFPVPGFGEKLQGMSKGDTKEFTLTVPKDDPRRNIAGKDVTFKVFLSEVKGKRLPELNDEFARGIGQGFESLEALRDKVEESLEADAQTESMRKVEERAVEMLVKGANIEFPPIMVEREIDQILIEQAERLAKRGIKLENYLKNEGKTVEEVREELREAASKRVATSLALGKLAEVENIQVSSEEIEAEVNSLAQRAGEKGEEVRKLFGTPGGQNSLKRILLTRKILERLREIASGAFVEKGEGEKPAIEHNEVQGGKDET